MRMRKFLVSLLAVAACGCSSQMSKTSAEPFEPFDSLTIEVDSMAIAVTLKICASPADTLMQRCLARFVGEQLFFMTDDDDNLIKPAYKGNLRTYLKACAAQKWDELRNDAFGNTAADEEGDGLTPEELAQEARKDSMWLSSYLMDFQQVYETNDYISWACHYDISVSTAAHPSFGGTGITVRKADGQPLGSEILKDTDSPVFRHLLKESLRQWLRDVLGEKADTDADLRKFLWGDDKDLNALPLPEQQPYLTEKGVALPYYENELLFCREPPTLILPMEQVKPFLTIE